MKQVKEKKEKDPFTELGIRLTVLHSQVEQIFSKCSEIEYTYDERLRGLESAVNDINGKITVLAKAVKKLAQDAGRLPKKEPAQKNG